MRWIVKNLGSGAVQAIGGIIALSAGAALASLFLSLPTAVVVLVVLILAGLALFVLGTVYRLRERTMRKTSPNPSADVPAGVGHWQGLADDLQRQRAVVREHYAELEKIIGPRPISTEPRSASDQDKVADGTGHGAPGERRIIGKTHENERINIANTWFIDCTFRNCTFFWDGLSTWSFQSCRIEGRTRIEAPRGPVAATVDLLKFLGFLLPEFAEDWKHMPDDYFNTVANEPASDATTLYRGRVLDAESGAPVVGVYVTANREQTRTAWTDDNGDWTMTLPAGRVWQFLFTHKAYPPTFAAANDSDPSLIVRLKRAAL